jgi:hypothetical protein
MTDRLTGTAIHIAHHDFTVDVFMKTDRTPGGPLADAELHFTHGALAGLTLVGFSIWDTRDGGRHVTFPARSFQAQGLAAPSHSCGISRTTRPQRVCAH